MDGPAIIEEKESTIVIGEDAKARVDEFGFVWINLNLEGGSRNRKIGSEIRMKWEVGMRKSELEIRKRNGKH